MQCKRCGAAGFAKFEKVGWFRWTLPPGPAWCQWRCRTCGKLTVAEDRK